MTPKPCHMLHFKELPENEIRGLDKGFVPGLVEKVRKEFKLGKIEKFTWLPEIDGVTGKGYPFFGMCRRAGIYHGAFIQIVDLPNWSLETLAHELAHMRCTGHTKWHKDLMLKILFRMHEILESGELKGDD